MFFGTAAEDARDTGASIVVVYLAYFYHKHNGFKVCLPRVRFTYSLAKISPLAHSLTPSPSPTLPSEELPVATGRAFSMVDITKEIKAIVEKTGVMEGVVFRQTHLG